MMQTLSRALLNAQGTPDRTPGKIRVLQFGEGNFLRAFCDYMLDTANEKLNLDLGVAVTQPIERGMTGLLRGQDCLYTVLLRGREDSGNVRTTRVVQCVKEAFSPYEDFARLLAIARLPELRYIISNTTEAGIAYTGTDKIDDAPPASYPGKLTRFLLERFNAGLPGLVLLPCELIDDNGRALEDCVRKNAALWQLPEAFTKWLDTECTFCSTLVDRIVTGYPRAEAETLCGELGYTDNCLDVAEPFGLWVIEAPAWLRDELPLDKAGCPVVFTSDVHPYKIRKVRMLNGAHTTMVLAAYLAGLETVGDCMKDEQVRAFLGHALLDEIMPNVPLDKQDVQSFAAAVCRRFENPFNRHLLLSIALNSVSKYVARVLPTLEDYVKANGRAPRCLAFGLSALIMFYAGCRKNENGEYEGVRDGKPYPVKDDEHVLQAFSRLSCDMPPESLAYAVLADETLWGRDLRKIDTLEETVAGQLRDMQILGVRAAMDRTWQNQ